MDLFFHLVKILSALWDLVEKYSYLLHKGSLNFKIRRLYQLHVDFIILWLWVILAMFIVGAEGFKVNWDYSGKFKLHQHLNILRIFLSMTIPPKMVSKCWKKIQSVISHVEHLIRWLLIRQEIFIVGVKPDLDKLEMEKRQNNLFP